MVDGAEAVSTGEQPRPAGDGPRRIETSDDAYGESYSWQTMPSGVVHITPGARVTGPRLTRLGVATLFGAVLLAYGAQLLDSEELRHLLLGVAGCAAALVLLRCLGSDLLGRTPAVRTIVSPSCITVVRRLRNLRFPAEHVAELVISSSSVENMIRAEGHMLVAVLDDGWRIELVNPGPIRDVEELRRLKDYLHDLLTLPSS
jgi:hypothetical protein